MPQKYVSSGLSYSFGKWFMITLILVAYSCKSDNTAEPTANRDWQTDYDDSDFKWGYIDKAGRFVIKAVYDDTRDFVNGLACVSQRGEWGMINTKGEVVVPIKYRDIKPYSEGLCVVEQSDGKKLFIDRFAKLAFECPYQECYDFKQGFARVVKDGMTTFIDKKGKQVEDWKFTDADDFDSLGFAVYRFGEKSGILSAKTGLMSSPDYEQVKIGEGIAALKKGGKVSYKRLSDGKRIGRTYDEGGVFEDGRAVVREESSTFLLYSDGREKKLTNNSVRYVGQDRWAEEVDDKIFIIDEQGKRICDQPFLAVFSYNCGILGVEFTTDNWGYIDTQGKEIIKANLPIIWDCSEDYIRFITNAGFGFMDSRSIIKISPRFIEVRSFKEGMARAQYVEYIEEN